MSHDYHTDSGQLDMFIQAERLAQTSLFSLDTIKNEKPKSQYRNVRSFSQLNPKTYQPRRSIVSKSNHVQINDTNLNMIRIKLKQSTPKKYHLVETQQNFYSNYKILDKIKQQQNDESFQDPHTEVLSHQQKFKILPIKSGLFPRLDKQNELKMKQSFKEAIQKLEINTFKLLLLVFLQCKIQLIQDQTIIELLKRVLTPFQDLLIIIQNYQIFPITISDILAANTSLNFYKINTISNFLKRLEILDLEQNNLNILSLKPLLAAISDTYYLKRVNLSKNILKPSLLPELLLIFKNQNLLELYLHWCGIDTQMGFGIFNCLTENCHLKVLDLSWNELGGNKTAQKAKQFLLANHGLKHFDLSNCKFDLEDSKLISEGLEKNYEIYGFHFQGNFGRVDERGFLVFDSKFNLNQHPHIHRIDSVLPNRLKKNKRYLSIPDQPTCWICDGWVEQEFYWPKQNNPVYLHLEFEQFEGRYMGQERKITRVVPPQEFFFFFTVDEDQQVLEELPFVETVMENQEKIKIQDQQVDMIIQQKNIKEYQIAKPIINKLYDPEIETLPRQICQDYVKPVEEKVNKWSLKNSIFKDWKKASIDLIQNCFEFDWSLNKIYRIIRSQDDIQRLRNHFKSHYLDYIECFKKYAIIEPIGKIFAITQNPLIIFVNQTNLIDSNLSLNDVSLKWSATTNNYVKKENPRNPQNGMVRYQFIEMITRIVQKKYVESLVCPDFSSGVEKLYNEHLLPEMKLCRTQPWRDQNYWNKECHDVLTRHKEELENMFLSLFQKKYQTFSRIFITLDLAKEFMQTLDENALLSDREVAEMFILSIQVQVDEINYDRYHQMNFVEFMEFIARISEKYPLPQVSFSIQDTQQTLENEEQTTQVPLYKKLEKFIQFANKKMNESLTYAQRNSIINARRQTKIQIRTQSVAIK